MHIARMLLMNVARLFWSFILSAKLRETANIFRLQQKKKKQVNHTLKRTTPRQRPPIVTTTCAPLQATIDRHFAKKCFCCACASIFEELFKCRHRKWRDCALDRSVVYMYTVDRSRHTLTECSRFPVYRHKLNHHIVDSKDSSLWNRTTGLWCAPLFFFLDQKMILIARKSSTNYNSRPVGLD